MFTRQRVNLFFAKLFCHTLPPSKTGAIIAQHSTPQDKNEAGITSLPHNPGFLTENTLRIYALERLKQSLQ